MMGVAPTVASREVQAPLWARVHGGYAGRTLGPCPHAAGVKACAWKAIIDQWKWSNTKPTGTASGMAVSARMVAPLEAI
jgi:hypothetical protein